MMPSGDTDTLLEWLEALAAERVAAKARTVERLLSHRSREVRSAAALALGRSDKASKVLRQRLSREPNELVLTDICEALSDLDDAAAVDPLSKLAREHKSQLVRRYALMALADISGMPALPFLEDRIARDRSRRVRATLSVLLLWMEAAAALPALIKGLKSKDIIVRRLIANLLSQYPPAVCRPEVLSALECAHRVEEVRGARIDLSEAVSFLQAPG